MAPEPMCNCMTGLFLARGRWSRSSRRLKDADAKLEADSTTSTRVSSTSPSKFGSETSTTDIDCLSCAGSLSSDDDLSQEEALKREIDALQENVQVRAWEADKYKFLKSLQLAQRNFGSVDLLRRIEDGKFVAVKKMPNKWMTCNANEFQEKHVNSEEQPWMDLAILKYLRRQNFQYCCKFFGVFQDATHTRVVTSFASEGDMFGMLSWLPAPGNDRTKIIVPIMRETFVAVMDLHNLGIAHGDLSLENVVLAKDAKGALHPKLIDFGMSGLTRFHKGPKRAKPSYTAPERHEDITWDRFLADSFALGVVFFSLMADGYPWKSTKPDSCDRFRAVRHYGLATLRKHPIVTNTGRKAICKVVSEPLLDVVVGLMELNPRQRLTLGERCWSSNDRRRSVWDMTWLTKGH